MVTGAATPAHRLGDGVEAQVDAVALDGAAGVGRDRVAVAGHVDLRAERDDVRVDRDDARARGAGAVVSSSAGLLGV